MQKVLLLCSALLCGPLLFAQPSTPNFFQNVAVQDIPALNGMPERTFPKQFTSWRLDLPALRQTLALAPWEFTPAARAHSCTIAVPNSEGAIEHFAVWQIALLDPALAARYPEIRAYAGESIDDPGTIIRISVTARGLHTMTLRRSGGVEFIEPYVWGQTEYYLVYEERDMPLSAADRAARPSASAGTAPLPDTYPFAPEAEERGALLDPVQLKTYRFAAATTGLFSQDHGGTLPMVLSAVVEYTNDISAIYERDMAIRLQLVANEEAAIYLDPATDPFTGTTVDGWANQNELVTTSVIGAANFDVGHVFARYINGNASGIAEIGVVCGVDKAHGGTTGQGNGTYGPGFVKTLGQEIGHQFGGGHTWNRCNNGGGRNGNTAYEPGSGSTIMSYGGSCLTDNVQYYKDPYFHSGTIEEIRYYVLNGYPSQCGTFSSTGNNPPSVTLPYQDNFYIPILTPFELDGTATDPDGDALTYCWEEIDTGPETPLQMPVGNSPLFRSRLPASVSNRYFPRINYILNNEPDSTDQLPTYTRDLTFRLTARDNFNGGGGLSWADVAFKSSASAGPFVVTAPNANGIAWKIGEFVQVTWDVANTDKAPVNCPAVNILLSTDNGQTWPIVLASGTGNDGSQYVLVPNVPTTQARVRVQAANNVFFNVSNIKFRIEQPTEPGLSISLSNDAAQICLPGNFSTDILTSGTLGFSNPASLDFVGQLPAGATASFASATLNPGETGVFSIDLSNVTVEGVYSIGIRAIAAGADTLVRNIMLTVVGNDFSTFSLQSPADGSTGLLQTQVLRWNPVPDATAYDLQFANSPSFAPAAILATKTNTAVDTFKVPFLLEKGKVYYWRVRPVNECGAHDWSEAFSFATLVDNCQIWSANDLPKAISANGVVTVESHIDVGANAILSDINVKQVSGFHNEFGQLETTLISPAGTQVSLFKNKCGVIGVPFNMGLDDNSPNNFSCPPPNLGGIVKPQTPLAPLIGQNIQGTWILRVKDGMIGAGGALEGFQLEFCSAVSLNAPYLVNNNVLSIESGINMALTPDLLLAEDANNPHDQLTFTLVTPPKQGRLEKNWGGEMQAGDQFTQADLDNGAIRYFDYGGDLDEDYFRFTVTDGEGGFLGTPKFLIQPFSVGTLAPADPALQFSLFPNPAQSVVWVAFGRPGVSDTRISLFDGAGRLVQTAALPAGQDRAALQLSALPRGFYAVRVENEAGVALRKLVVE